MKRRKGVQRQTTTTTQCSGPNCMSGRKRAESQMYVRMVDECVRVCAEREKEHRVCVCHCVRTHLAPHPGAVQGPQPIARRQEGLGPAQPPPLLPLGALASLRLLVLLLLVVGFGQIHQRAALPVPGGDIRRSAHHIRKDNTRCARLIGPCSTESCRRIGTSHDVDKKNPQEAVRLTGGSSCAA